MDSTAVTNVSTAAGLNDCKLCCRFRAASSSSCCQARLKDNAGAGLSSNALSAALETFLLDKAELELTEVLAAYHKVYGRGEGGEGRALEAEKGPSLIIRADLLVMFS